MEGKCYGGPWDKRELTAECEQVRLVREVKVSVTPPPPSADLYRTAELAGVYVWRGDRWTWYTENAA